MPFVSDEEYAQFQAMRGGAQQQAAAADGSVPSFAGGAFGGLQQAYQGLSQSQQQGPNVDPNMAAFNQRLTQLASDRGLAGQWKPAAGAGGGYFSGSSTDPAQLGAWQDVVKQANLEASAPAPGAPSPYAAASAPQIAPGAPPAPPPMGGGWSQPAPQNANGEAQAAAQQQAAAAPRRRGRFGFAGGGGGFGQQPQQAAGAPPADASAAANQAGEARQRAMQQAAAGGWGSF